MTGTVQVLLFIAFLIIMSFTNVKGGGWGTNMGYKEYSQDESKALDYNDDTNNIRKP